MGFSGRGTAAALGCALIALGVTSAEGAGTVPAGARKGAATVTPLPAQTLVLTIGAGAQRSCASDRPLHASGVGLTTWTASVDGSVAVRLRGDERNDWDLALFDSATG